ncbi:hypothetical protein [Deinococcus marmoris]|uniref:Uncharacterized protein n=1 Tax=Deinococcus marmoris TaxID=249408 RepID=A0A1U7P4Q6_9DEIO|nr:hypothetical protein [Deinococcus marmoris]OLV20154.1 hypothetical protein BOO71_0000490 [Deinococcus marmoris]
MTASMINPADIAAIKAQPRRAPTADLVPPEDCALSFARAARLTDREWRRAWISAMDVLTVHTTAARKREDGSEIAAYLLDRTLDLTSFALTEFAGASADPRRRIRDRTDEALAVIWDGIKASISEGIEVYRTEIEGQSQATLAAEREQMTAGADAAAREATEARRALDAASAQLTREREASAREIARLTRLLDSERSANNNRERDARNEAHQLRQDLASSRTVIASLNAECERLEAQVAAPIAVEEVPMPSDQPKNALESASLCLFLRKKQNAPGLTWKENQRLMLLPESHPFVLEWRAAYPTPEAMLAQLRAVVLPMLGRVAA